MKIDELLQDEDVLWLDRFCHNSEGSPAHNATVVGTLSGKKEMLEGTWEHDTLHESLAQYLLLDFTLENSKTTYIFSGQKKPSREYGEGLSALRLWKPVADFQK